MLDSLTNAIAAINPIDFGIASLLLFTSLVWLGSYQLGLFLNLRYSKMHWVKRFLMHIQTLAYCPLIGLIETFPAFWATLEYVVRKNRKQEKVPIYDFYVIRK